MMSLQNVLKTCDEALANKDFTIDYQRKEIERLEKLNKELQDIIALRDTAAEEMTAQIEALQGTFTIAEETINGLQSTIFERDAEIKSLNKMLKVFLPFSEEEKQ